MSPSPVSGPVATSAKGTPEPDRIAVPASEPSCDRRPGFILADLRENAPDPRGRKVDEIFWITGQFAVYKARNTISAMFSDTAAEAQAQRLRYARIGDEVAEFNHLIRNLQIGAFWRGERAQDATRLGLAAVQFERDLARCIAHALNEPSEDGPDPRDMVRSARQRLAERIANRARTLQLAITAAVTVAVIAVGYYLGRVLDQSVYLHYPGEASLVVVMGSIGALFSTSIGFRKMPVDPLVLPRVHVAYVLQRVLVGALAALIIYVGVRSGLLSTIFAVPDSDTALPNFWTGGNEGLFATPADPAPADPATAFDLARGWPLPLDPYWLAFLSVLAGFSERLVPNILHNSAATAEEASAKPA